jgi:hypothetical protein
MSYNGGSTIIKVRDANWVSRTNKRMYKRLEIAKEKEKELRKQKEEFVSQSFLIKKEDKS